MEKSCTGIKELSAVTGSNKSHIELYDYIALYTGPYELVFYVTVVFFTSCLSSQLTCVSSYNVQIFWHWKIDICISIFCPPMISYF